MLDGDPWWREGICAEIGPDLFFVGRGESIAEAQAACRICPVRVQCLADSLRSDPEYGVFGGYARPTRRPLTRLVARGEDPLTVARAAIAREEKREKTWTSKSTRSASPRTTSRSSTTASPPTSARTA